MSLRYKAAIVGASETTEIGVLPETSETQLHIDSAVNAMNNAGIGVDQIDGIASTMNPAILANYLGIVPKWIDNTSVGGTSKGGGISPSAIHDAMQCFLFWFSYNFT